MVTTSGRNTGSDGSHPIQHPATLALISTISAKVGFSPSSCRAVPSRLRRSRQRLRVPHCIAFSFKGKEETTPIVRE